jgi:hypothetical protein
VGSMLLSASKITFSPVSCSFSAHPHAENTKYCREKSTTTIPSGRKQVISRKQIITGLKNSFYLAIQKIPLSTMGSFHFIFRFNRAV